MARLLHVVVKNTATGLFPEGTMVVALPLVPALAGPRNWLIYLSGSTLAPMVLSNHWTFFFCHFKAKPLKRVLIFKVSV